MPAAILTYHSLDDSGSVLSTSLALFAEQMEILRRMGARVLTLSDLWAELQAGATEPLVAITFDDGFKNVHDIGLPILEQHGFPATVFVVSDYVGRDNGWPTQPPDIERLPLATWEEIEAMSRAGVEIGAHTRTHPDLPDLSDEQGESEMAEGKSAVEQALGLPVETFAYPYGHFHARHAAIAARHFRLACSASLDYVRPDSDPMRLERLDMFYLRNTKLLEALFTPRARAYLTVRRRLREFRARIGAAK